MTTQFIRRRINPATLANIAEISYNVTQMYSTALDFILQKQECLLAYFMSNKQIIEIIESNCVFRLKYPKFSLEIKKNVSKITVKLWPKQTSPQPRWETVC